MSKTSVMWYAKARGIRVTSLLARDGSKCWICGEELIRKIRDDRHPRYITFDHVTPRALGGRNTLDNIRLAHQRCNNERGIDPVLPHEESEVLT